MSIRAMKHLSAFILLVYLLTAASVATAQIYVDDDATSGGTGASWASALRTIGQAMDVASTGTQVWVAKGTYRESVAMKGAVSLYGGFAGSETSIGQRNLALNKSIIDASQADSGGPADHVISVLNSDSVTIDGFTITGGNANDSASKSSGGGVYSSQSPLVKIANCLITANNAAQDGGGICAEYGTVLVENCVISNNAAHTYGGGGYAGNGVMDLTSCTVSGNSADFGAGLSGIVGLRKCTVSSNTAGFGGGLDNTGNRDIAESVFEGNQALDGGGIYMFYSSSPRIQNCVFSGNSALDGGGIWCNRDLGSIVNCTFWGNTATQRGGGICGQISLSEIANCIFSGNTKQAVYTLPETPSDLSNNLFHSNPDGDYYDYYNLGTVSWTPEAEIALPLASGNSVGDPLFVNPALGDFHLQSGSAAIDRGLGAGSPPSDFEGNPRTPSDGMVDVGAYEAPENYATAADNQAPISRIIGLHGRYYNLEIAFKAADNGSGVRYVDLFQRKDGGDWIQVAGEATASPIYIAGPSPGQTGLYEYCTVATDRAGNREDQSTDASFVVTDPDVSDKVLFVDCGAPLGGSGASWAQALQTIGQAMDMASTGTQIRVAGGNYPETITFKSSVAVFGGFDKTESVPSERARTSESRVLAAVMDGVHDVWLDGFTVSAMISGGVTCRNTDGLSQISNCIIGGNRRASTGGGIWANGGTFSDCIIRSNLAEGYSYYKYTPGGLQRFIVPGEGGGAYVEGTAFQNCIFEDNISDNGGGVHASSSTFFNCIFRNNLAQGVYGEGFGGGAQSASSNFINCTFDHNYAKNYGSLSGGSDTTVRNSIFSEDIPGNTTGTFEHCLFWKDAVMTGTGNFAANPGFLGSTLRPGPRSPAIDAATSVSAPAIDFSGFARPFDVPGRGADGVGAGFDIGAYENINGSVPLAIPSRIAFGMQPINSGPTVSAEVVIANDGETSMALTPDGIALSGGDAGDFAFVGALNTTPIRPGGTRVLRVCFDPASEGTKSARIVVTTENAPTSQSQVALTGIGLPAATPTPTPTVTPTPTITPVPTGTPTSTPSPTPTPVPVGVSGINRAAYNSGVLRPGKPVYSDRTYTFGSPVPPRLLNQSYIVSKQSDKDTTSPESFLSFTVDQNVVVYVAIDARITPRPDWLKLWTRQPESLNVTDPGSPVRLLYSKRFGKGKVTLEPNRASSMPTGRSMYTVVIVPDRTGVEEWPIYAEPVPTPVDRLFAQFWKRAD